MIPTSTVFQKHLIPTSSCYVFDFKWEDGRWENGIHVEVQQNGFAIPDISLERADGYAIPLQRRHTQKIHTVLLVWVKCRKQIPMLFKLFIMIWLT